jgi:hypothetical protein
LKVSHVPQQTGFESDEVAVDHRAKPERLAGYGYGGATWDEREGDIPRPASSQELHVPLYPDKNGRESFWKVDPDFRNRLSIPFSFSEILSLYLAQDSVRPLYGTVFCESLQSLFEKVWAVLPKPLFKEMVSLRGSFMSGIPAQKNYGDYREFIKVIEEAIEGRRVLQLLYQPRDQAPAERRVKRSEAREHFERFERSEGLNGWNYWIGPERSP